MSKIQIVAYYIIIVIGIVLEIIFLFQIPYYRYSDFLKNLKLVRILFGLMICLIEIYFRVVSYSETLLLIKENPEGKNPISSDKNILKKIDIILMIIGATISLISLLLNIIGLASSINYLKKEKTDTDLKNTYYIKSLLLLFENCLVTICWIYFVIYWGIYIYKFFTETKETPKGDIKKEDIKEKKNDENPNSGGNNQPVGSEPPPPLANSRNIANASSSQRTSVDQQIITRE